MPGVARTTSGAARRHDSSHAAGLTHGRRASAAGLRLRGRGPGLGEEGGCGGARARLRRGARPGRIFMRSSFCGLWTRKDKRVGLRGPPGSVRRRFVRRDDGARRRPVVGQPPRLGRTPEPTGYAPAPNPRPRPQPTRRKFGNTAGARRSCVRILPRQPSVTLTQPLTRTGPAAPGEQERRWRRKDRRRTQISALASGPR
jgi:hypothetical protein